MLFERPAPGHKAIVVHVDFPDDSANLEEFQELATSAELLPADTLTTRRDTPHPRWFLGSGKVEELHDRVKQQDLDLVLVNHELSPGQQRNLEERLRTRVMTRTELILHIFADRARTHEGQLQVELAQLTHAQSRMVRGWTHLDRQKGGVNMRGAGETQLELDQRMLSTRVKNVRQRLEHVHRQRAQSRRRRSRARVPTVALAGYTNAGKSTLFNALTRGGVHAADQLFATLDPTMRQLDLGPSVHAVLADTVGFIRDLPVTLVDAFKATLEEIAEADLIVHVIDAVTFQETDDLRREVMEVLGEIGAGEVPTLEVMNKVDLIEERAPAAANRVWVSAQTGEGLAELTAAITDRLGLTAVPVAVELRPQDGRLRAWLYRHADVENEDVLDDGRMRLCVRLDQDHLLEFERFDEVLSADTQVHRILKHL